MKKFLMKLSDLTNAYRVLEIMDKVGCDIEEISDGRWMIKPKWGISETDAKDLQNIILHKEHYCTKYNKLYKTIFKNVIEGHRCFWWHQ